MSERDTQTQIMKIFRVPYREGRICMLAFDTKCRRKRFNVKRIASKISLPFVNIELQIKSWHQIGAQIVYACIDSPLKCKIVIKLLYDLKSTVAAAQKQNESQKIRAFNLMLFSPAQSNPVQTIPVEIEINDSQKCSKYI